VLRRKGPEQSCKPGFRNVPQNTDGKEADEVYEKGGTGGTALQFPFFERIRQWQDDYGYRQPAEQTGNWLCPCVIRDHFEVLKAAVCETGARPINEEAGCPREPPLWRELMARITFVQPCSPMNLYPVVMPTVGPYILAELMRRQGHEVSMLWEPLDTAYDRRTGKLHEKLLHSDVVGISAMTATAARAYEIADAVRARQSDTRIVFGGPHVTFRPDEALLHGDVVVKGEAEAVIHKTVEADCPRTVEGKAVKNLDDLPWPNYSITPGLPEAMRWVPLSTSRGCPFRCRFCSVTPMFGRRYRFRSTENVLEELRYRVAKGQKRFFFTDDNLTAKPSRTKEMLRGIIEGGLRVRWIGQVRGDVGRDEEMLQLAARSGCKWLVIGFESPSDKVLESYHKGQTVSGLKRCIEKMKKAGIKIHGLFMLGSDEDDSNSGRRTVAFCKEQKLDVAQFSILTPFPGTDIYNEFKETGRVFTECWPLYDGAHVVFRPAKLTALALQKMWVKTWKCFYTFSRPLYYLTCRFVLRKWRKGTRQFKDWIENLQNMPTIMTDGDR